MSTNLWVLLLSSTTWILTRQGKFSNTFGDKSHHNQIKNWYKKAPLRTYNAPLHCKNKWPNLLIFILVFFNMDVINQMSFLKVLCKIQFSAWNPLPMLFCVIVTDTDLILLLLCHTTCQGFLRVSQLYGVWVNI